MVSNTDSFGQWVKQRRTSLDLTQRELARQASCAEVTLRKIEAGNLRPSAQLAAALIKGLGTANADLPALLEFALSRRARQEGPPPARLRRAPGLPAPLTPLLGRDHDVAVVHHRLREGARLITLVGPPGVGKTRLALAVAERALDDFQDGVRFVRLGPIADPELVAPAIVQALGFQMSGPYPPIVQMRACLEEKHLLLVLDNFEHVVEAAPLVDDLLRRCPWLHVLVTSRQPLRVRGERQMPVLPLALPAQSRGADRLTAADALRYAAVALFEERAQAVQPDFAVTDANAGAVAELCRRLDGLPLAIELVAARVKLLPPDELLARLSGPWMLSVDGLRDVSARQKTLRGAIGWSYDLLTPAEQSLFAQLAVFVGGCTLAAAEAVCSFSPVSSPPHVLDGIASLLDKSLLRREIGLCGEARYAMLETIHEYALDHLVASGASEAVRQRHLAWCLAVAEPALSSPFCILERASWQEIDGEIHNLSAALEWALGHDGAAAVRLALPATRTLANHGFVREARTWIDRTLALPEAGAATIARAALFYCKGIVEFLIDQTAAAELSFSRSLTLCADLKLPLGQAGALYFQGRLAAMAGNAARAETTLECAAGALLHAGELADWGHVLAVLAEIVMLRGDLPRSRALHTQAMARALPPEQRHQQVRSVGGLAELALVEGDLATAQRLAEECLALCRHKNSPAETAWLLTCLGEIAMRRGNFAAAHSHLNEALALGRHMDAYWRVLIVRADLGDLAAAEGKPGEALRLYRETLPILLQRGILAHPPNSLRLACLAGAVGQHEVAAALLAACSAAVAGGLKALLPITQADFDRTQAAAQAVLDADAFEAAWATGRELSPQAAVTWGLHAIHVSEQPMVA
jgi:predicted ATPase/transcriptional regulator with XRE-family HTH domain